MVWLHFTEHFMKKTQKNPTSPVDLFQMFVWFTNICFKLKTARQTNPNIKKNIIHIYCIYNLN